MLQESDDTSSFFGLAKRWAVKSLPFYNAFFKFVKSTSNLIAFWVLWRGFLQNIMIWWIVFKLLYRLQLKVSLQTFVTQGAPLGLLTHLEFMNGSTNCQNLTPPWHFGIGFTIYDSIFYISSRSMEFSIYISKLKSQFGPGGVWPS